MPLIEPVHFNSGTHGPHVLILSKVHGNEDCGRQASQNTIRKIENDDLNLVGGSVTLIPICNPRAHESETRQIDENLNRIFGMHSNPDTYEKHLANEISPIIQSADVLLDIHSTLRASDPFSITASKEFDAERLMRILGCRQHIITNRAVFENPDKPNTASNVYANSVGVPAITVECGQHNSPDTVEVAEQAIINTLGAYDIIRYTPHPIAAQTTAFSVLNIYFNDQVKGYNGNRPEHLKLYAEGDIIAYLNNGEPIIAPIDGTAVLFPNDGLKEGQAPGTEQFYVAVPEEFKL